VAMNEMRLPEKVIEETSRSKSCLGSIVMGTGTADSSGVDEGKER